MQTIHIYSFNNKIPQGNTLKSPTSYNNLIRNTIKWFNELIDAHPMLPYNPSQVYNNTHNTHSASHNPRNTTPEPFCIP